MVKEKGLHRKVPEREDDHLLLGVEKDPHLDSKAEKTRAKVASRKDVAEEKARDAAELEGPREAKKDIGHTVRIRGQLEPDPCVHSKTSSKTPEKTFHSGSRFRHFVALHRV